MKRCRWCQRKLVRNEGESKSRFERRSFCNRLHSLAYLHAHKPMKFVSTNAPMMPIRSLLEAPADYRRYMLRGACVQI